MYQKLFIAKCVQTFIHFYNFIEIYSDYKKLKDPHKLMCNVDFFTGMISVYHCIVSILNVYLALVLTLQRVTGKIFEL